MADIELTQGDTAPNIEGVIRKASDKTAQDLTEADSVRYQMRKANTDQYAIDAQAVISNAATGEVVYTIMPGDLSDWGDFEGQWEIHWSDGTIQTTLKHSVLVNRQ